MIKKHLILIIIFFNTILVAKSQGYSAVEGPIILDTLTMETVVVTGTRSSKRIANTPVQTQVISQREILNSGMNSLENVLSSQLPGMEFHQAGYGTSMTFQGLDARYVLILVDGERLSGDVNGNIDFTKIPLESIQQIEVIKGSSSVLYGSSAMGATINIITKRPSDGFEGSGYYNFGGYNHFDSKDREKGLTSDILNMTAAAYVGYSNKKFSSTTDITYQGVDPYRMVSKSPEMRHYFVIDNKPVDQIRTIPIDSNGISVSGWRSVSVNQKLEYKISNKLTAKLNGGYYWKNRYDLGDYSSGVSESKEQFVPIQNYQGYNVSANIDYNISDKHNINFSFHTTTSHRKEQDASYLFVPKQSNNVSVGRILYQSSMFKNNDLTIGLDFNRETLNLDLSSGGYVDKYSYNTFAMYVQDNAKLSDNIDILIGLRVDNYGFTSPRQFVDNIFSPDADALKSTGLSATPQLALKYSDNQFSARVNYSMGFRTPSLKERYMEYLQPYIDMTIVGNPNLVPETNNYISISGDYLSNNKKLYLSVNLYGNFFKDKIDTYHNIETDELIYQNTLNSELYGLDVFARLLLLKGWWMTASYSFNHRTESGPVNSAQYIFSSPHTASLQTNYLFGCKAWTMGPSLSLNYYSPKTFEDMMPSIIHNSGSLIPEVIEGIYKGRLEGYVMCNLSYTATLKEQWSFTVGANNLFNYQPSTASFNSAVTPGITGYFSIRVKF